MRRGLVIGVAVVALGAGAMLHAQAERSADVQMKAAQQKADVEGDLKGAIEAYKKIVATAGANRALAVQALLRMAECYQKLGDGEARKVYERIAREFADQKDVAADAARRLAALSDQRPPDALTSRLVWSANVIDASGSMTPDGRLLAMRDPSTGDVAIRDMSTGQIKRLMAKTGSWPSPEFANFPVLSPDLRQVVYEWNDGSIPANYQLRVMANEVGAAPRVLTTEFVGPMPSAWSPDGKSILASVWKQDKNGQDKTGHIVWVSAADGTIRMLKSLEWRLSTSVWARPSLAPDGRYVAYSAFDRPDRGRSSIYVIAADGSSETVLVTGGINEAPIWTPDGKHVVYTSNRSGTFGLWSIAMQDGKAAGAPVRVKANIGRTPAVGFTRSGSYYYLNYADSDVDVFLADLDPGSGKIRGPAVRLEGSSGANLSPRWSPDGRFVAFDRIQGQSPGLVVHSIETGEEKTYAKDRMSVAGNPMWSRDGKTLLRAWRDGQGRSSFYSVDLKTGETREVVSMAATSNSLESALSPDGKTVYTNASNAVTKGNGSPGITAFDLATSEKRQVFVAKDGGLVPGLGLSPDGHTLAFRLYYVGRPNETHLCVIGVDGSNFRELYTETEPRDGSLRPQIAWTRDGRTVLFTRATPDGWQLMRIPAEGGKPEFTGLAGRGQPFFDLNADGSRIVFNDLVATAKAELWVLDNLMSALKP